MVLAKRSCQTTRYRIDPRQQLAAENGSSCSFGWQSHAGQPILAVENVEETYPIPLDLLGCQEDVFMLSVSGDSMIKAGILDHDYIVARKQNFANNGDIVVALIDGEETTVKRYFRELRSIRLQPENDAYTPITGTDNIQVLGKVIAVFRML